MFKKIFVLGVAFLVVFTLWACDDTDIPYNAILYDKVNSFLHEDFLKENLTNGAWDEHSQQSIQDDTLPRSRTVVIKSQADFYATFAEFPSEINFETDMILLYGETTSSARDFYIKSIELNSEILRVEIRNVMPKGKSPPSGSITPYQRWTAVKMDRIDNVTIEVI